MVYAGARNETDQQMADVLHYTLPQEDLHTTFGALNTGLVLENNIESTADDDLTLKINNSGWLQEGHSFLPSYVDIREVSASLKKKKKTGGIFQGIIDDPRVYL